MAKIIIRQQVILIDAENKNVSFGNLPPGVVEETVIVVSPPRNTSKKRLEAGLVLTLMEEEEKAIRRTVKVKQTIEKEK